MFRKSLQKISFRFSKYLQTLYQKSKLTQTPFFTINSNSIRIIQDPLDFYALLSHSVAHATHRIGLSCLYLSTGPLQRYLLDRMGKRHKTCPDLQSALVFDFHRSQRQEAGQSPMEMINNWAQEIGTKTTVGFHKISKGKRVFGQILGVHHQKIYVFDDRVVISGANLSKNYFLNRRDRCISIQSPELSDYLYQYLQVLSQNANKPQLKTHYKLWKYAYMPRKYCDNFLEQVQFLNSIKQELNSQKQRSFVWQKQDKKGLVKSRNEAIANEIGTSITQHQPIAAAEFVRKRQNVRDRLFGVKSEDYIENQLQQLGQYFNPPIKAGKDIYLFPFLQWSALAENLQYSVFSDILRLAGTQNHTIKLTSGYLNIDRHLLEQAVKISKLQTPIQLICAAPEANSFFRAGGFKSLVPVMYRCYEWFLMTLLGQKVSIKQFSNGRWSYHAKGVWIEQAENSFLTVIGSSNFNQRSRSRDSEFQFYIYSGCEELNGRLKAQWKQLEKDSKKVTLNQIESDSQTKVSWVYRMLAKLSSSIL